MTRAIAVALLCAACTTTSVAFPLAPRVLFLTNTNELPQDRRIDLITSWHKTCEDRDMLSAKAGPTQYGCGDRDYTVDITCEGGCTIARDGGAAARDAFHADSKQLAPDSDGEIRFHVAALTDTLTLTVALRSGDEVKRQSETYRRPEPEDVVVSCAQGGTETTCDQLFAVEPPIEIRLHSASGQPLPYATLGGVDMSGGHISLNDLLNQRAVAGDYTFHLVLDKPPHERRRDIMIHVR